MDIAVQTDCPEKMADLDYHLSLSTPQASIRKRELIEGEIPISKHFE